MTPYIGMAFTYPFCGIASERFALLFGVQKS
jgi:hypothetical protein